MIYILSLGLCFCHVPCNGLALFHGFTKLFEITFDFIYSKLSSNNDKLGYEFSPI